MSTRKHQIKNLKSKFDEQINYLQETFNKQRSIRKDRALQWETEYQNQVREILQSYEQLISQRVVTNSLWENLMEWKFREESSLVWQDILNQKEENIRRITKHVTIDLGKILKKESQNSVKSLSTVLKERIQHDIESFKELNENKYHEYAFPMDLYSFSKIDPEHERKIVSENVENYFYPSRIQKRRERDILKVESLKNMKNYVDSIVQSRRIACKEECDADFEDYLRVSRDELKMINEHMLETVKSYLPERQRKEIFYRTDKLTQEDQLRKELHRIIDIEPSIYKTDIGVHDEAMQQLQNEIDQLHERNSPLINDKKLLLLNAKVEHDRLIEEEEQMRQKALDLRKRYENAVNECTFLSELNQLTEEDLLLEIEKKRDLLLQKRTKFNSISHEMTILNTEKERLEKELNPIVDKISILTERVSNIENQIAETTFNLEVEQRNAASLLSKDVWKALERFEGRERQNINQAKKHLAEYLKHSGYKLRNTILNTLYENTIQCLQVEGKNYDELSQFVFRNHLSNFYLGSKIHERKLISHLSFLQALFDSTAPFKKPEKLLKKQSALLEKKYLQWTKIQDEFIATAKSSETIHDLFVRVTKHWLTLDLVSNLLWFRQEIDSAIAPLKNMQPLEHESSLNSEHEQQESPSVPIISNSFVELQKSALKKELLQIFSQITFYFSYIASSSEDSKSLKSDASLFSKLDSNSEQTQEKKAIHDDQNLVNDQGDVNSNAISIPSEIVVESPLMHFTDHLITTDESLIDPILISISQSQHVHIATISKEQARSTAIQACITSCELVRKRLSKLSSVDVPNLNDAIHNIQQHHIGKFKIKPPE